MLAACAALPRALAPPSGTQPLIARPHAHCRAGHASLLPQSLSPLSLSLFATRPPMSRPLSLPISELLSRHLPQWQTLPAGSLRGSGLSTGSRRVCSSR